MRAFPASAVMPGPFARHVADETSRRAVIMPY
jgi:hypothetical protein